MGTLRSQIESTMVGLARPQKVLLPQYLFDAFVQENDRLGYAGAFVLGVPVEVGNVADISLWYNRSNRTVLYK